MALLPLLLALTASPWNLHCPRMPVESAVPAALRAQVHSSFPWVPLKDAGAIHAGPVWVFALSSRTEISRDGDGFDLQGRYLHRSLVAVGPDHAGRVVVRGRRLRSRGPRTQLRFTRGTTTCRIFAPTWCARRPPNEVTSLSIPAGRGWRVVRTEVAIGATGCFALRASGDGLNASLPLAVPGPYR